jgi:ATP-dependent RNA helicase DeaD
MGFSRDVEKIIKECPEKRQTMMFSATISQDIDYLAKKYTRNPAEIAVKSYVDPSKLKQVYYDVADNRKFSLLVSLLKKESADLVMVFCGTRRNVDFISDNLIKNGIHAKAIHGKIEQKKRIRVLEEFHKKGLGVLVCTDVAARGLDIKGVSHVYNYDVPNDLNDYIHRIGRTARAGKEGKAITILASRDYEKFGNVIQSKDISITPEKLPQLEIVKIRMDSGRNRFGRNSAGRDFSRGPRRNNERGRGFGNQGNNRDSNRPQRNTGNRPKRKWDNKPRSSYNQKSNSRRPLDKRGNNFRNSNRPRR